MISQISYSLESAPHRHSEADSNAIPFVKKTSLFAVVLDRYDLK